MDMPSERIIVIDDNEGVMQGEILAKIIAAALIDQIQLHSRNIRERSNQETITK